MKPRVLALATFAGAFYVLASTPDALADELVLEVPGDVDNVVLTCGGQKYERAPIGVVAGGTRTVRFPMWPGRDCDVTFERHVGSVVQLGRWRCDDAPGNRGCVEEGSDVAPAPPLPPGQIKILTTDALPNPTAELVCPGGYRQRASISDHTVLFHDVPSEDCELFFKGGAPYRYRPMQWGTWGCNVVTGVAVCERR